MHIYIDKFVKIQRTLVFMLIKQAILLLFTLIVYFDCLSQTVEPVSYKDLNDSLLNERLLDSLKSVLNDIEIECLKIEFSYEGYESSGSEIIYFDSLAMVKAFQCSWNLEGRSGENINWFENGKLFASYEEILGQRDDPEITFIINPLKGDKLNEQNLYVNNRIKSIEDEITVNQDQITEDNNGYRISIEEMKNYGFDFTETTTIYINKILYNQLFKD